MNLTRRDALTLFLASLPAVFLPGCGGGEGGSDQNSGGFRGRYIALGDSYAYGYSTRAGTPTGTGDTGYVKLFADALATVNGGSRPTVLNLAIPGETTATYLRTSNGTPSLALSYNTNYAATDALSQSSLLTQRTAVVAEEEQIGWVTLQIGGDDLLNLLVEPTFLAASSAERQTIITATLDTLRTNLGVILTQMARIRNVAPQAKLFVLGYPDPFAGLGAANPLAGISTPLTQRVNNILTQVAGEISAQYVDLFAAFQGKETTFSLILTEDPPGSGVPDFHPSAAGYAKIAELLSASLQR